MRSCIFIEVLRFNRAIDQPGLPTIEAVYDIAHCLRGEHDLREIAQHVIGVRRRLVGGGIGLGCQLPIAGVGVGEGIVGYKPIVRIIGRRDCRPGRVPGEAIAVRVVIVVTVRSPVFVHLRQASGVIIGVRIRRLCARQRLGLLGNAADRIAGERLREEFFHRPRRWGVLGGKRHQFPIGGVVAIGFGNLAEGGFRQEPRLRVALILLIPGLQEHIVVVVDKIHGTVEASAPTAGSDAPESRYCN